MNGAGFVGLLLSLELGVFFLISRLVIGREANLSSPLVWFFGFWVFGAFLLALPLFTYAEEFSFQGGLVLFSLVSAYCIGDLAAGFASVAKRRARAVKTVPFRAIHRANFERTLSILVWLGVIGTSLLIVDSILTSGLNLSSHLDLSNAKAVRDSHMNGEVSRIGPLHGVSTALWGMGGAIVALVMYFRGLGSTAISFGLRWGCRAWLLLAVFSGLIVSGSRMEAIFALCVAGFGYLEGRRASGKAVIRVNFFKRFGKWLLLAPFILVALWFLTTYFLEKRVGGQDAERLMYTTHRATLNNDLRNFIGRNPSAKYFILSVSYFSTPLPTYEYYVDLPDARAPGPFWGEYDFPTVARWIRRFTLNYDPIAWELARMEIFRPLGDIGFGTNVWATLARDIIADFGKLGAVVFFGFLGYLAASLHLTQRRAPSPRAAVFAVYVKLVVVFSGLVSVLYLPIIQWGLISALVLAFMTRRMDIRVMTDPSIACPPKARNSAFK
jgi:hypothetical protein